MYGLPQTGLLAQEQLIEHLKIHGYYQSKMVPGLWHHKTMPITSTLVVNNFGVKYENEKMQNMLGDKGCALRTVDKGISRGPDLCPLDKQIKDRRARIRAGTRTWTGIQRVRAVQCYILSSRYLYTTLLLGNHLIIVCMSNMATDVSIGMLTSC